MKHAIFIGSNPSSSAVTHRPFCESTKSGKMLREWIKTADVEVIMMLNVYGRPTPGNKPLTQKQIKASIGDLAAVLSMYRFAPIVAVGKAAVKALTLLQVPFFELPHPSGMNRKLNDPKYIEEKLKGLSAFADNPIKIES